MIVLHLGARKRIRYDGTQLASLWAFKNFDVQGDSLVTFTGPCRVDVERLVDVADAKEGAFIESPLMLHFIVEHFGISLETCILRQRLLVFAACETLAAMGRRAERRGDDLYYRGRKLSVSIAAPSPVSCMIHFGVNIETKGAPVPAAGLEEMKVPASAFAKKVAEAYAAELDGVSGAATKVRGIE